MEKSTAQEKQQQEIDEYIAKMSPLLQEHGFPHVTMKPISEGGERKILLQGEVVSKTDRGVKDSQIVLEAVLTLSDPPAEIVNKVRYRLRDY